MYRKENARRNQSRRYRKALYFVDNLSENVLGNVYSLDLNYDMGLKIHGRVHSGKLRITVTCKSQVQKNLEIGTSNLEIFKKTEHNSRVRAILNTMFHWNEADIYIVPSFLSQIGWSYGHRLFVNFQVYAEFFWAISRFLGKKTYRDSHGCTSEVEVGRLVQSVRQQSL